jgi:TadE-like protein
MQFRTRITSRTTGQRGTALVEFALCLPIVALILVGIVEFGFLMNAKNDVTEAARDGARQAAVNAGGSTGSCAGAGQNWLGAACTIAPSGANICLSAPDGSFEIGSAIQVTVSYTYNWITPLGAATTGGNPITLVGKNIMRLEQKGTNLPNGALSGSVCVQKT